MHEFKNLFSKFNLNENFTNNIMSMKKLEELLFQKNLIQKIYKIISEFYLENFKEIKFSESLFNKFLNKISHIKFNVFYNIYKSINETFNALSKQFSSIHDEIMNFTVDSDILLIKQNLSNKLEILVNIVQITIFNIRLIS